MDGRVGVERSFVRWKYFNCPRSSEIGVASKQTAEGAEVFAEGAEVFAEDAEVFAEDAEVFAEDAEP